MRKPSAKQQNWLLAIAVLALAVFPLLAVQGEFGGSDANAAKAIGEMQPGYQPWFKPLFEPPSKEIESLLFASQAALGSGVIGYVIGRYRGQSERYRGRNDRQKEEKK